MEETFLLNFYNGIHFIMEGEGLLKRFFFVVGIYYLWKMSFEKHRNWISDETLSALKYSIFLVLFTCCVALSKFNPLCVHCITDEMASPRFSTFKCIFLRGSPRSQRKSPSFRSFPPGVNLVANPARYSDLWSLACLNVPRSSLVES